MSTRAFVGFGVKDKWQGAYHHNDGQPASLGPIIWRTLQHFGTDSSGLEAFRTRLLDVGRFEALARDVGVRDVLGNTFDGRYEPLIAGGADPLLIPFVYLVDVHALRLRLLSRVLTQPSLDEGLVYEETADFDIDGAEPDWRRAGESHPMVLRSAALEIEMVRRRFDYSAGGCALAQRIYADARVDEELIRALFDVAGTEPVIKMVREAAAWLIEQGRTSLAESLRARAR